LQHLSQGSTCVETLVPGQTITAQKRSKKQWQSEQQLQRSNIQEMLLIITVKTVSCFHLRAPTAHFGHPSRLQLLLLLQHQLASSYCCWLRYCPLHSTRWQS
jgi:hypothetical protein